MHRRFGLIGKKLSHSFSRQYFTAKFEKSGIDASYHLFELPGINDFPGLLEQEKDMMGLNVTIPYKQAVIPYLDSLSPEAAAAQAVNTIRIQAGKLTGHNTDIVGFRQSLLNLIQGDMPTQALILGSGGASQAVKFVLAQLHIPYRVVSREADKGDLTYDSLDADTVQESRLIVNCTPLGMYPEVAAMPAIPVEALGPDHFVFDLIYNPEATALLQAAKQQGAKTRNGLEMLILQAEAAWEIWNQDSEE